MPKKKKNVIYNPEVYKEAGNKAFKAENYEDAVSWYTKAIEITSKQPNHLYFSNRAKAYL